MNWTDHDAVLLDLDSVISPTAEVHMRAWADMFNAFLFATVQCYLPNRDTFGDFGSYVWTQSGEQVDRLAGACDGNGCWFGGLRHRRRGQDQQA